MTITLLYAAPLLVWYLVLSLRVVNARGGGISLGDGGDANLLRRIRAHANFAEYVPILLLLMAMLEFSGLRGWLLHVFGVSLLVARLLHGYALSFRESFKFGRYWGTVLTFLLLLFGAGLALWVALARYLL